MTQNPLCIYFSLEMDSWRKSCGHEGHRGGRETAGGHSESIQGGASVDFDFDIRRLSQARARRHATRATRLGPRLPLPRGHLQVTERVLPAAAAAAGQSFEDCAVALRGSEFLLMWPMVN